MPAEREGALVLTGALARWPHSFPVLGTCVSAPRSPKFTALYSHPMPPRFMGQRLSHESPARGVFPHVAPLQSRPLCHFLAVTLGPSVFQPLVSLMGQVALEESPTRWGVALTR